MIDSFELQKKVIQALADKMPDAVCPLCKSPDWNVQLGTSYLPLKTESASGASWAQNALPGVALICGNCGNTHFLNLRVLFPDLKGIF